MGHARLGVPHVAVRAAEDHPHPLHAGEEARQALDPRRGQGGRGVPPLVRLPPGGEAPGQGAALHRQGRLADRAGQAEHRPGARPGWDAQPPQGVPGPEAHRAPRRIPARHAGEGQVREGQGPEGSHPAGVRRPSPLAHRPDARRGGPLPGRGGRLDRQQEEAPLRRLRLREVALEERPHRGRPARPRGRAQRRQEKEGTAGSDRRADPEAPRRLPRPPPWPSSRSATARKSASTSATRWSCGGGSGR
jgi:hypothetical protein